MRPDTAPPEDPTAGGPARGRPGVFDLDAAVADAMGDDFLFSYQTEEWALSHPGTVDYRDAEAADGGDLEAVRVVIAVAMGAEWDPAREQYAGQQWDAFDKLSMPSVGLDRLFRAWMAFYGIAPGELPGSAAQFAGTAAPSNRASRRQGARPNSARSSRPAGGATYRRS